MDSLKQRIVDYVGANQPVKRADLIVVIGSVVRGWTVKSLHCAAWV